MESFISSAYESLHKFSRPTTIPLELLGAAKKVSSNTVLRRNLSLLAEVACRLRKVFTSMLH